jgi:hypothetical protein
MIVREKTGENTNLQATVKARTKLEATINDDEQQSEQAVCTYPGITHIYHNMCSLYSVAKLY